MSRQVKVWEIRANEDLYESPQQLIEFLQEIACKWCFQLEAGEKTGYRHYQGRMTLWKQTRKDTLMNDMHAMQMPVPNYLEPSSTEYSKGKAFYSMKVQTRLEGPWQNTDATPMFIPWQYDNITLYPFQQSIIDSGRVEFRNSRTLNCIVSFAGCDGKSTCASIGALFHRYIDLPPINDADKLIASVCDILGAKECRDPKVMFFDMPRAMGKDRLYGMYTALEQVKKGFVYDLRNRYREWWFHSPQIWVFTNDIPAVSLMSKDRWVFYVINDAHELWPVTLADLEMLKLYATKPVLEVGSEEAAQIVRDQQEARAQALARQTVADICGTD